MEIPLLINPKQETEKIVAFLKDVQKKTKINRVVIGLSGGVDSTTVYYLLRKAYKPENIIGVNLPYEKIRSIVKEVAGVEDLGIPAARSLGVFSEASTDGKKHETGPATVKVRLGNIMARVRMIILFDLAKKHDALVCGTENKSEKLLGYYTRFGDSASDIELLSHLYKTQVYRLAEYLEVPEKIINQSPTAGLWAGQTDEGEFGFTYKEADQVLYLYFDNKKTLKEIKNLGFINADKIIKRSLNNQFKLEAPYHL
jgi:NAD+ synthase